MEGARFLAALLLAAGIGISLVACERQGPAERAGEKVEESTEKK